MKSQTFKFPKTVTANIIIQGHIVYDVDIVVEKGKEVTVYTDKEGERWWNKSDM